MGSRALRFECGIFGTNSIPIWEHKSVMELHAVPAAMPLPSLSTGCLKAGYCLARPMSFVLITQAINVRLHRTLGHGLEQLFDCKEAATLPGDEE